jgi:hypothetical protein
VNLTLSPNAHSHLHMDPPRQPPPFFSCPFLLQEMRRRHLHSSQPDRTNQPPRAARDPAPGTLPSRPVHPPGRRPQTRPAHPTAATRPDCARSRSPSRRPSATRPSNTRSPSARRPASRAAARTDQPRPSRSRSNPQVPRRPFLVFE